MTNEIGKSGTLYIVATPIGNLEDISTRALKILASVNLILVEDTRHSRRLLRHYSISKPLVAFHEFSEARHEARVIADLERGQDIALISDAGTPLINDPGYSLVSSARKAGLPVCPIPGACAVVTALSVAGLATDRFCFEGFLPSKSEQKQNRLKELLAETRTMVFYESPHRLVASLETMMKIFGERRQAVLAKELTKRFESIIGDTLIDIGQWLAADRIRGKGEFVIIVAGASGQKGDDELDVADRQLMGILREVLDLKTAAVTAARISGKRKNLYYRYGLEIKDPGV